MAVTDGLSRQDDVARGVDDPDLSGEAPLIEAVSSGCLHPTGGIHASRNAAQWYFPRPSMTGIRSSAKSKRQDANWPHLRQRWPCPTQPNRSSPRRRATGRRRLLPSRGAGVGDDLPAAVLGYPSNRAARKTLDCPLPPCRLLKIR